MDMQLEEGEISDRSEEDGFNLYTPLERPVHKQPVLNIQNEATTMEDEDASSSKPTLLKSDSDSDDDILHAKKLKPSPPKSKKYSIWTKDPDGDLTDILNQFGMDEKRAPENCRNVENYPLPFDIGPYGVEQKRRKFAHRRKHIPESNFVSKRIARELDSLEVTESNTIEEVAHDITKKLKEDNFELILRIVLLLGKDKAIELYEKTKVIEKMGGMLIVNGSRKRTSGGVFIFLVRTDKELSEDKITAIFENDVFDKKKYREHAKIRKKLKKQENLNKSRRTKNKDITSELSNPPPSPDLPELPPRKDLLTELASLDSQKGMARLQRDEEEDDTDLISYDDFEINDLV